MESPRDACMCSQYNIVLHNNREKRSSVELIQPNVEIDLSTVQKKVDKLNMHQSHNKSRTRIAEKQKRKLELRVTCCLDAGMKTNDLQVTSIHHISIGVS